MTEQRDTLTGLLTAQPFLNGIDAAAREGGSLVLVVMDLDHFMGFNKKYGHQAGDQWIRAIALLFAETFSNDGGLVARYGGDEFMAAVRTQDLFEVYQKAEALRQHVEQDGPSVTIQGEALCTGATITMGLASLPGNASDVTDLVEKGKQALRRAKIAGGNCVTFFQESDTLTGLHNLHASQRALQGLIDSARASRQPLSVFLLDIDRFKELNDQHGHRAGDEVLKRLAHILQANFEDIGLVARAANQGPAPDKEIYLEPGAAAIGRIAGDEFIVVLPGKPADSAFILAEEVRRLVEGAEVSGTFGDSSYRLNFTISGGIATFPGDASDWIDLLRKAGEALYRSKQIGRNRVSLPTPAQMVTKTSYFTQIQLERLTALARRFDKTEAFLLREALDDLLRKYGEDR